MRTYSTCSPASTPFFAERSPVANLLFPSSSRPPRRRSTPPRNETTHHACPCSALLARCKARKATLVRRNSGRQEWPVFAGIVADRWRMDRHSATVAARQRQVRLCVPQRRLRRLLRAPRRHNARKPLLNPGRTRPRHKPLLLLLRNPATLFSKCF